MQKWGAGFLLKKKKSSSVEIERNEEENCIDKDLE